MKLYSFFKPLLFITLFFWSASVNSQISMELQLNGSDVITALAAHLQEANVENIGIISEAAESAAGVTSTQEVEGFGIAILPFKNPAVWLYLVFLIILASAVTVLFKAAPYLSKL